MDDLFRIEADVVNRCGSAFPIASG